jgi:hypothetical protein
MDFGQGIVAVIPATGVTHVPVLVGVQWIAGTGPAEAGIIHRTVIPIVAGTRVVRVGAPSLPAARPQLARVPVVTVIGCFATEAAHVLLIREAVAVIVHPVGTNLAAKGGFCDSRVDHLVLIIAVRAVAEMAHISIQIFVDQIDLVVAVPFIARVNGARILVFAFLDIGARDSLFEGCRSPHPPVCALFVSVASVTAEHKKKA